MGETEDKFAEMKRRTNMSDEEQKRYVTDVGDTGSLLHGASSELLKLLPLMWEGKAQATDTLAVVAAIREAMVEGVSNVEILEAYLREWIKAAKKGEALTLTDARTAVLQERAETVVGALSFDDEIKFTFTSFESFPEGETDEEVIRRWKLRVYAEFELDLDGFLQNVAAGDRTA
jgi:hypothetical protein